MQKEGGNVWQVLSRLRQNDATYLNSLRNTVMFESTKPSLR